MEMAAPTSGKGWPTFLVDGVELGDEDGIDFSAVVFLSGVLDERGVEVGQLVHSVVAHKRLSDEADEVRLVHGHESCKCSHQGFVVLHSSGSIDQHYVDTLALRFFDRFSSDSVRLILVASVEHWDIKIPSMCL